MSKGSDQPVHTRSLIRAFASRLNILLLRQLTKHHLEFLSLKGGCTTSSSESKLFKISHCWKSHASFGVVLFDALSVTGHMLKDNRVFSSSKNYVYLLS